MTGQINGSAWKRPLYVDFDSFTDNDPDFRRELIDHMVDNLRELVIAHQISAQQKDGTLFLKVCHKVKTTLVMLSDKELDLLIEIIKPTYNNSASNEEKGCSLEKLCAEIIKSLLSEKG